MLVVAACINGETAIFGLYHKEAIGPPLLHATMERTLFSIIDTLIKHTLIGKIRAIGLKPMCMELHERVSPKSWGC